MKKLYFLLLIAVVLFTQACQSDDDNQDNLSGFERISDRDFVLTDFLVRANGAPINTFRDLLDCDIDNITRYESSGAAISEEGLLKCDPQDPQTITFFWTLISNDSKLIVDFGGPNLDVFNILLNDGNRLILESFTIEDIDGDNREESIIRTFTYERI